MDAKRNRLDQELREVTQEINTAEKSWITQQTGYVDSQKQHERISNDC
jgi:hypothetical protein